jgi:hypothetical protein
MTQVFKPLLKYMSSSHNYSLNKGGASAVGPWLFEGLPGGQHASVSARASPGKGRPCGLSVHSFSGASPKAQAARKTAAAAEMMAGRVGRWARTVRPYGSSPGAARNTRPRRDPHLTPGWAVPIVSLVLSRLRTWSLSQWGAALVALGMTGVPHLTVRPEPGHRCQCRAHAPGQECECPMCRAKHPVPGSGRAGSPPCHGMSAPSGAPGTSSEPDDAPRIRGGCSSSEVARVMSSSLPPVILAERGSAPGGSPGERVRQDRSRAQHLAVDPETPPPRNG